MSENNAEQGPYESDDVDIYGPHGPAIAKVSRWLEQPLVTARLMAASWDLMEIVNALAACDEPVQDQTGELSRVWSQARHLVDRLSHQSEQS